jgi:hypothetical protein
MMAKSITKNESVVELEKIRRFTETELAKLSDHKDLPFCYQLGNDTIIVGNRKVKKTSDDLWRVTDGQQQLFDFFTRKDAIFYCIALHKKDYNLAKNIYENDQQLNRLEFDAVLYRIRHKKAQQKDDSWGTDFYSSRYTETMDRIAKVKQEIKKNLNLAKYIKL